MIGSDGSTSGGGLLRGAATLFGDELGKDVDGAGGGQLALALPALGFG